MKKRDNWKDDIVKGEDAEYRLLKYLRKKYPKAYKVKGNFKDYDIEVPEKDIKIEVKRDIGSQGTNNYFIEYECNYEDSGLSATKANYWVIYDEQRWHWIKTNRLKALSIMYGRKWEGTPEGGVSNVKAYLIPKEIIKANCE